MLLGKHVNIIFNVVFVIASHYLLASRYLLQFVVCHVGSIRNLSHCSVPAGISLLVGTHHSTLKRLHIIVKHHWTSMKMAQHVYKESLVVYSIVIVVVVVNCCHCHYYHHHHHHHHL